MSIQSEIDRLNAAKADIQSALVEGGQTVESTDTLTDYAGKIRALSSGFAEQIAYHNEDSEAHSDIRGAIPTKTSDLTNDSGFITEYTETDPTVPAWAKEPTKPSYTANEVGADASGSAAAALANAKTYADSAAGTAESNANSYTDTQIAAIPTPDISGQIDTHNTNTSAHSDIRSAIPTKTSDLANDSGFIDTMEAISLILSRRSSVNGYANLTVKAGDNIGLTFEDGEPGEYGSSDEGTMTISATVPTKTSQLTNDSGFITSEAIEGSGIEIGPDEPTDTDVWIDTDETSAAARIVASFKGRSGAVMPQSGDYTYDMVGADAVGAAATALADAKTYTDGKVSNPNLFHNWYFANCVNQRGQTEYTNANWGAVYAIDRWHLEVASWNVAEYKLTAVANYGRIVTRLGLRDDMEHLIGKTVTFSVRAHSVTGGKLMIFGGPGDYGQVNVGEGFDGVLSTTVVVPDPTTSPLSFSICLDTADASAVIEAAKLELGSTQTLAHQDENGNWVLNEIPDYGEELAKCQRYFLRLGSRTYGQIGMGVCHADGVLTLHLYPSTAMRINPTVTAPAPALTGRIIAVDTTTGTQHSLQLSGTGTNRYTNPETGVIQLAFTPIDSTLTAGRAYQIQAQGGGYVDLSADL